MDGLRRGLLGLTPDEVRDLAASAVAAGATAVRSEARVGTRPRLDRRAEREVEAAFAVLRRARADRRAAVAARHAALAAGNVAGALCLALAFGLVGRGSEPVSTVVGALVVTAPVGPAAGLLIGAARLRRETAGVGAASAACAAALERLGVATLGEANALRIRFDDWLRRRDEATRAAGRSALAQAAWQQVAGPLPPAQVDEALAGLARLRREHLARLASGLAGLRARSAPTAVAGTAPTAVAAAGGPAALPSHPGAPPVPTELVA